MEYNYITPSHYRNSTKETWEMMVDVWGVEAFIAFCEMNAFKYRMRIGTKPNEDVSRELEKIKWYENKAKQLSCTNTPSNIGEETDTVTTTG